MVVWGGLRPIASRVFYDCLALAGLSYATFTPTHLQTAPSDKTSGNETTRPNNLNGWVLVASVALTIGSAGNFTNRWTISFPMVPLLFFQGLRRIRAVNKRTWLLFMIQGLSILCILLAFKLSILFPAVELPPIRGPYHVGTVDVHVPALSITEANGGFDCTHLLPIRILYPTLDEPTWPKYLVPTTALEYCRETMRFGAPPPLQEYDWMLHTWRLVNSQTRRNASLAPGKDKFPVVVFSHGLGGNADIYSYQTMSLAARGNVVVVMNHMDGSGPFVRTRRGAEVRFDHVTNQISGSAVDKIRRNQTDVRVREVLAATEAVLRLDEAEDAWNECHDSGNELLANIIGLSFVGRLEVNHITAMGHSFGGATAITAAKRRPDLYHAVVAHEPAIGWIPDDARRSLFAKSKTNGLELAHTAEGLFDEEDHIYRTEDDPTVHDIDSLFLFSHEWWEKDYARCHLLGEMHKAGRLGPENGVVHFSYIQGAHHNGYVHVNAAMAGQKRWGNWETQSSGNCKRNPPAYHELFEQNTATAWT
ncbi:hypothetical protein ACA910_009181 [Epithemia clementina (nom. ined.)]